MNQSISTEVAGSPWADEEIRELIGELIVAGFDAETVNEHAKTLIEKHRVKNIILFTRNVTSVEQVIKLNSDLQKLAREAGHPHPLIICTDQENGIVRRVAPGVPGLPGNMAVGATENPEFAYEIGRATARQLLHMGVNMNLAPVLDVNNNPKNPVIGVRSYGENPDLVAQLGTAMVRGLQENGVVACAKHFPGHGDTAVDSHLALPTVPHSRERLEEVELKPFRQAIGAGVDVIMTAHVVFPSIEKSGIPATLSKAVLTDFLRGELGFEGVITTDCLEMNAILDGVGVGEGAVQALLAGADFIMVSHQLERQEAAIQAIFQAVKDGRVTVERLAEAASRIRRLRVDKLGNGLGVGLNLDELKREANLLQREVSRQSVTVVGNVRNLLPLQTGSVQRVDLIVGTDTPSMVAADKTASSEFIVKALKQVLPQCEVRVHKVDSSGVGLPSQAELADSHLALVGLAGTVNHALIDFANLLSVEALPLVVMALQSPYDLSGVTDGAAKIAIYEYTPWMILAGVEALFGLGGIGRLPVTV